MDSKVFHHDLFPDRSHRLRLTTDNQAGKLWPDDRSKHIQAHGGGIGANVFLTASVPPNSIVVQEDANVKVMKKKAKGESSATEFQI